MDMKTLIKRGTRVMIAFALVTMVNIAMNIYLATTENESMCAYASAPITADQGNISSYGPKTSDETDQQTTVGVIKSVQCSEVCCYYTLSSLKNGNLLVLRGGPDLSSRRDLNKKGTVVKVTWHTEKIYHSSRRTFKTEQVIDSIEISK
mgnify:CR=1 FL=1